MAPSGVPVPVQLHRIYNYAYYRSDNHALLQFAKVDLVDPTACPYHGWKQSNKLHSTLCKALNRQCCEVKGTTLGRRKLSVRAQRKRSLESNTMLRSRSSSVSSTYSWNTCSAASSVNSSPAPSWGFPTPSIVIQDSDHEEQQSGAPIFNEYFTFQ